MRAAQQHPSCWAMLNKAHTGLGDAWLGAPLCPGLGSLLSCSPPGSLRARPPDKAFSRAIYTGGELLLAYSCTRHRTSAESSGQGGGQHNLELLAMLGCVSRRHEDNSGSADTAGAAFWLFHPPGCSLPFSQCCRRREAVGPCETHNLPAVR